MGLLDKAIQKRTETILEKHFGFKVPFERVLGGRGSGDGLSSNINPFMCAITDFGLIFIHESLVTLTVSWVKLLNANLWNDRNISMLIESKSPNRFHDNLEYPFSHRFNVQLNLNSAEDAEYLMNMYRKVRFPFGYSDNAQKLNEFWTRMSVKKPVSYAQYIDVNKKLNWPEAQYRESCEVWGQKHDAEFLLYYTASGICGGFINPELIETALDILIEAQNDNTKFTKQPFELSDENRRMALDLKGLPFESNILFPTWVIGRIECRGDNERTLFNPFDRWTIFNLKDDSTKFIYKIWDYQYEGAEVNYSLAADFKKSKMYGSVFDDDLEISSYVKHSNIWYDSINR